MQKCKFANLTDPDGWAGTTSREVAKDLGIGKSSVNDHRSGTCVCFRSKIHKIHPKAAKHLKVLTIDVENSPNVVHTWGLYNQNIGINQIVTPATTFGVGYKWYHEDEAHFLSDHEHGHEEMVRLTHELLTEADIVIGFNQTGFDLPHLGREFVLAGLNPPAPYRQVDLLKVARKQFKFSSNKLDWLAQQFGLGAKTSHEGHTLWVKCMDGDPEAWAKMAEYCRQDVVLTEKLYDRLRSWIPNHPHISMFSGKDWGCPNCGEADVSRDIKGEAFTNTQRYPMYQCRSCGTWIRSTRKLNNSTKTRVVRA